VKWQDDKRAEGKRVRPRARGREEAKRTRWQRANRVKRVRHQRELRGQEGKIYGKRARGGQEDEMAEGKQGEEG
jgi:hypothetical protein